jgi:hypothetical protein
MARQPIGDENTLRKRLKRGGLCHSQGRGSNSRNELMMWRNLKGLDGMKDPAKPERLKTDR